MSSGLLTLSKYVVLVVLYLFFLRVLRAVWVELREPKVASVPASALDEAAQPAPARRRRRGHGGHDDGTGRLRITAPEPRRGEVFALADELTVGRAADCGVSLPEDTFTSQVHARVFRRAGETWVEDLGSTNGTLLNDHKVATPVVMRPGDTLRVGRTELELTA